MRSAVAIVLAVGLVAAADADAIQLCVAAEDELDMTEQRAAIEGVPWVPREMRATVRVAFGCDAGDR
jgi:hypothetical protein